MRLGTSISKVLRSIDKYWKCLNTVQVFLINLPKGFEHFMITLWPVLSVLKHEYQSTLLHICVSQ